MLQAFNPNKNIMSALINQYTFKHLKNKAPSDFICIEPFIYNGIKFTQNNNFYIFINCSKDFIFYRSRIK